jgi:toxin secretion/phage lysis holin
MSESTVAKGFIGLVAGVFGYLAGCLNEMVVILALLVVMDYILGIAAVIMQGKQFDSTLALKGAFKKALYAFVIVLGYLGDYLIHYMTAGLGMTLPVKALLGVAVTLYLIGTEGFSIVKNLVLVGVPVPGWFAEFFGLIRDEANRFCAVSKKEAGHEDKQ